MRRRINGTWVVTAGLTAIFALFGALAGCDTKGGAGGGAPPKPGTTKTPAKDEHEHAHEHGPHGGPLIEVGAEEYHLEWLHTDDGTVTLYVLDDKFTKEVGIEQPSITIETKIGDETKTYELMAVKPAEGTKASKFEIVDKDLLGAIESLGDAVKATIKEVKIGEKSFSGLGIEKHDHDH